jgi:hypothetical protein
MSRSSVREGDGCVRDVARAQTEPLAALAALFAVCAAVTLYAGVLGDVTPRSERDLASPTLDRVHDAVTTAGVAVPDRLAAAPADGPQGYRVAVTLTAEDREWRAGPTPPPGATDAAVRSVGVRLAPGRVRAGRLGVVVWS